MKEEDAATPADQRLWEVDVARGVAVVMMITYHFVYDINFLTPDAGVDPYEGFWRALQVATGSTFLALVGVSFWITFARERDAGRRGLELWRARAGRAAQVLGCAALVSLGTFAALGGDDAVRFGILHLIGVLLLCVLPVLVRLGGWNALLGGGVIVLGVTVEFQSDVPGLLALGVEPSERGVDWYPLLPWGGVALMGIAMGRFLYPSGHRSRRLQCLGTTSPRRRAAGWAGRHSLPIYLIHQPVLIALTAGALLLTGTRLDPS